MILRQYLHTSRVVAASYPCGCGTGRLLAVIGRTEAFEPIAEALGLPILVRS